MGFSPSEAQLRMQNMTTGPQGLPLSEPNAALKGPLFHDLSTDLYKLQYHRYTDCV